MIKISAKVILPIFFFLVACNPVNENAEFLPSIKTMVLPAPTSTTVWFPPTLTPSPIPPTGLQPTPDMRPGLDAILFDDPFLKNKKGWQTYQNSTGSVAFGIDELTIAISKPKGNLLSLYSIPPPENYYWEITASPSLCRGTDSYGLLSRASGNLDYYQIAISCEGLLRFDRIKDGSLSNVLQNWTPSGQVAPGSPQVLRLGLWIWGNEMRFFINDVYQFGARGLPPHSGQIGLFAHSGGQTALTVNFKDMVIRLVKDVSPTAEVSPVLSPTRPPVQNTTLPTLSLTPAGLPRKP